MSEIAKSGGGLEDDKLMTRILKAIEGRPNEEMILVALSRDELIRLINITDGKPELAECHSVMLDMLERADKEDENE